MQHRFHVDGCVGSRFLATDDATEYFLYEYDRGSTADGDGILRPLRSAVEGLFLLCYLGTTTTWTIQARRGLYYTQYN